MGEVTTEAVVDLPRDQVWAKLKDLTLAQYYVPGVERIAFNTTQQEGVGASRKVFLAGGRPPLDETVMAWDEGRRITLRLHAGDRAPPPFKAATFTYAIEEAEPGTTRLLGTLSYTLPGGILGALFDKLVLRRILKVANDTVGVNFKRYYETGEKSN